MDYHALIAQQQTIELEGRGEPFSGDYVSPTFLVI
jgi:hypothetical protein